MPMEFTSKLFQSVIISIWLLNSSHAMASSEVQTVSDCDGPPLIAAYNTGDWTRAISLSEGCLAYHKTQSPPQSVYYLKAGSSGLNILAAFSRMLSLAQIHAMLGHQRQSEAALDEAIAWAQKYQFEHDDSPLFNAISELSLTRGYLLESIKDRKGAAALYRQSHTEYADARLALFAFEDGRLDDATKLTQSSLIKDSKDPLALAVRAEIERSRGYIDAARSDYGQALKWFSVVHNPAMAIFFFDRDRILSGAARLGVKAP